MDRQTYIQLDRIETYLINLDKKVDLILEAIYDTTEEEFEGEKEQSLEKIEKKQEETRKQGPRVNLVTRERATEFGR